MMTKENIQKIILNVLGIFNIKVNEKTENILIQIFKFLIVGGIATIIDWFIYFILYNYLYISPLIANILSFSISTIYNYIASVKWVFDVDQTKSKSKIFFQFILFSVMGLLLTELFLFIGVDKLNVNAMLTKIIATIIVMVFNFVTRKMFLE